MKNSRFLRLCLVVSSAALLMAPGSIAQTQGGGGGGTSGGSGRGGSAGGGGGAFPQARPTQPERTPTPFPEMQRPVFLQGKVVFENGEPAPPNVVIERLCAGQTIPEDYTDSRGQFSFEVGRNSQFIADASTTTPGGNPMGRDTLSTIESRNTTSPYGIPNSQGITERELIGCALRAVMPGYISTSVELSGRRVFDNPDVGTIVLRRLGDVEGLTVSATSLQAPKTAQKAFRNGSKSLEKQKWDKAQEDLEAAVAEYPEYAEAWLALGQAFEGQQESQKAREAYNKAIESDAKYMNPYLRLAMMDAQANEWESVAKLTRQILQMNPYEFPEAYFLDSMAHLNLNNHAQAEKSAREAIKMEHWRHRPQLEQLLGLSLALQNNYEEARVHLTRYLEISPDARNAPEVRQQVAQLDQFLAAQGKAQPAAASETPDPVQ